jgi:hypothetical protein
MLFALLVLVFNMLLLALALELVPRSARRVVIARRRDFWL